MDQSETTPSSSSVLPHRLWNGLYEVLLTPAGTGRSTCGGIALNRWSNDSIEDSQGFFLYLRDCDSHEFWSVTALPTPSPHAVYLVQAGSDSLVFRCEHADISASLEVTLATGDPMEIRRLRLHNSSGMPRRLEVTSFLEVVLMDAGADADHPAFVKLFLQTEFDKERQALLAHRRARGHDESWPWMVHALAGAGLCEWETDRLRFIGRNHSATDPVALEQTQGLSGTVGNVLDGCFSLRTTVEIPAGGAVECAFVLGIAKERTEAVALVDRWRSGGVLEKRFQQNEDTSPLEVRARAARRAPWEGAAADAGVGGVDLHGFNGYGGFSEDGTEYVIRLPFDGRELKGTPLPWINVMAGERCGMLISESGAAHTWCRNSQANRLTPWSNDPVSDPHGEALYLRDEAAQTCWSPLPGPAPAPCAHEVRHGWGYSRFCSKWNGLENDVTFFVPQEAPLRVALWRLKNQGDQPRELSLFAYQRLVLGTLAPPRGAIVTSCDAATRTLLAVHPASGDFSDGVAFAFSVWDGPDESGWSFTCDREAFLGPHGSTVAWPEATRSGRDLDGTTGADLDACFAQRVRLRLEPQQTIECAFILGEALGECEWRELVERFRVPGAVRGALKQTQDKWRRLLGGIRVKTPVPAIDWMANGWLAYQAVACRMWARTAFYQASGAYGFRDQLQDAANLICLRPQLTREQILLHARHQFTEGDVLHWWHPAPIARGLRTRFSDDLLWLPYATAYYLRVTGDWDLLQEQAPFERAPLLEPGEAERYLKPERTPETASLYEHCCRALDRSLTSGAHGLPLMGTGDWNDGMNRVGREGRGESVWLGFFIASILEDFIPICKRCSDGARAEQYSAYRENLCAALESSGWDGAWYRRAYYDDGTPLGTHDAAECRIDSLSQSWAVISRVAQRARAECAMDAVEAHLISAADGIIRLLTPAFNHTKEDPGYIKGYVAGVRENGGQYTHAACWVVKALAELGRSDRAAQLLERLLPVWHASTPETTRRYMVEPYVIAADIYGEPPHVGRGGWTWYTGSAGWAYRVILESVLGVSFLDGKTIVVRPCVPNEWSGYGLTWRHPDNGTIIELTVENPNRRAHAVVEVEFDGAPLQPIDGAAHLPVPPDGQAHCARIKLG